MLATGEEVMQKQGYPWSVVLWLSMIWPPHYFLGWHRGKEAGRRAGGQILGLAAEAEGFSLCKAIHSLGSERGGF